MRCKCGWVEADAKDQVRSVEVMVCAQTDKYHLDLTMSLARAPTLVVPNPRKFWCIQRVVDISLSLWFRFNVPRWSDH
jgi:hypothetical protein